MTETSSAGAYVPVRSGFVKRVFVVFAILALLSAAISVAGRWAGHSISMAGHTDDRTVHEIVIGNDVLAVPANMIRFEASRRNGVAARLDLYMLWPEMDGYSAEARDAFNHVDGDRSILFVSFEPRMMSRDMSGRFQPISRQLMEGPARLGPGGLKVYSFSEKSGYVDEVLIVGDEDSDEPFVARCLAGPAAKESLAPCERDIQVGQGLNLIYRRPAGLADSWREVDAAVRAAAERFIQTGG